MLLLTLALLAAPQADGGVDRNTVESATRLIGLEFTDAELEQMIRGARNQLRSYAQLRETELANSVPPALVFVPAPRPTRVRPAKQAVLQLPEARRPDDLEELVFADIRTLASLIRSRQVSCAELCETYLARLRRIDEQLQCVITFTEERARKRAAELDSMLERGVWLGPLHGIPYGAKDLLATRGYKTTWGAKPYADQVIDEDAAVIRHLDRHGAVLIAKLTLGALAMGDVWFGGQTKNPWNPRRGSSGSSAGSAAATAAGGVAFAVGSETLGSIVSPSVRCGCSSLRPTFGVVDTTGAMALTWSMDKLGPLCRSLDDAAIVFPRMLDSATRDQLYPTEFVKRPVDDYRVGYVAGAFRDDEAAVLDELRELGVEPVPIELPEYPVQAMRIILGAEAAAAFDELTRSDRDELLVRQDPGAWPNLFRTSRLIPAVEYLRAQRLRTLLIRDMRAALEQVDLYVHPASHALTTTNLTGHPTVVAPRGESRRGGGPGSIGFTGQLYGEVRLLNFARAWQLSTGNHLRHPK